MSKKEKIYSGKERIKIINDFIKIAEKMESIELLQIAIENNSVFTDDIYNNLHEELQRLEKNEAYFK